jgi:large subunit ribosomal protein L25
MTKNILKAQKRTITGRKVKKLRKEGILPSSVYGKGVSSLSIQVNSKDFLKLKKEVGESGLIYLDLDSNEEKPVLIANFQVHPVSELPVHVDFLQVNLKEAVKTEIPIELIGEPIAVSEGKGILIQPGSTVEVEALPTDLPEKIEIDVANLAEVDDAIFVKDIKVDSSIKILSDPEELIAKISAMAKEETAEPAQAEGEVPQAEGETTPESSDGENSSEKAE